jgi:hypothetical protein
MARDQSGAKINKRLSCRKIAQGCGFAHKVAAFFVDLGRRFDGSRRCV